MRITNKIMQNNTRTNVNTTKVNEDILSTQMSTGKKNVRPSDDPVTAIRALRLRSDVSQLTQFYKNNIPDADAWLNVTSDALHQVSEVITGMVKNYNKGVNQYLTAADREIVLQQLKGLQAEAYATGNADYAGRYIFTGYRTDTPLTFTAETSAMYEITEQLNPSDLSTLFHTDTIFKGKKMVDDGNGNTTEQEVEMDLSKMTTGTQGEYTDVAEQDIANNEYHRIRLSYKELDASFTPVISYLDPANPDPSDPDNVKLLAPTKTALSSDIAPCPYDTVGDDDVIYLSDTGEILLGKNVYETLSGLKDNDLTRGVNEAEIRVTYRKNEFAKDDLRPDHYFYCRTPGDNGQLSTIANEDNPAIMFGTYDKEALQGSITDANDPKDDIFYNTKYLAYDYEKQVIEYDVGFNQRLRVNTTADEAFKPGIVREVEDMIRALEDLGNIEGVMNNLKEMIENSTSETEKVTLQKQYDAANKAYTLERENVKNLFSSGITVMQGYLNAVNVAATNCGARGSRLDLVRNRMMDQKATFEDLKSENEDIDISTTAVQLQSAELTYEASLMATSKIMKTNLMQYI